MAGLTIWQKNSRGQWAGHGCRSIVGRLKAVGAYCNEADLGLSRVFWPLGLSSRRTARAPSARLH